MIGRQGTTKSHTALLYKENEGQKNIPTENKSKQDAHADKH